jgi:exodeoxyribonuclease-3
MRIATWNVNSVRVRLDGVLAWLARTNPDAVCLQETKTVDADFPIAAFAEAGYQAAIHGQKSYNGVALLSKTPITDVVTGLGDIELNAQARLIAGTILGVRVISAYVPNGTALKDPKCAYKIAWLQQLRKHLDAQYSPDEPLVIAGDYNVAPRDVDSAEPEKWAKTVLAHPSIRAELANVQAFGLVDVFAAHHPEGGHYSWWDYRTNAYANHRGGVRIDHLMATPCVSGRVHHAEIDHHERGHERPSDHAPVFIDFVDMPVGPSRK